MNLLGLILILFPGFFSVNLDSKINEEDILNNKFLYFKKYLYYTYFILLISFAFIYLIVGSESIWDTNLCRIEFVVKYLILSFFIASFLPKFYIFLKNNFRVTLKVVKDEKK